VPFWTDSRRPALANRHIAAFLKTTRAGFETLHRVALTEDEIVALFTHVRGFARWQNEDNVAGEDPRQFRAFYEGGDTLAWRYEPKVSVNNDGQPDNLIIWQGIGLYQGGISGEGCNLAVKCRHGSSTDASVIIKANSQDYVFDHIEAAAESAGLSCHVDKQSPPDRSSLLCQFDNTLWYAINAFDEKTWFRAELSFSVDEYTGNTGPEVTKKRRAILRRVMKRFATDVRHHSGVTAVVWCPWPLRMTPDRSLCRGEDLLNP
jgi:hypothetical protein